MAENLRFTEVKHLGQGHGTSEHQKQGSKSGAVCYSALSYTIILLNVSVLSTFNSLASVDPYSNLVTSSSLRFSDYVTE